MKRRPLSGQSGGSNRGQTARDRRDSQASASGNTFLDPLYTDQLGRIGFKISATSPFYFDPAKGFDFRVDPNSGFEVSSASPYAFRRVKGGNVDVDPKTRALVAKPSTDDVKDAVGESVTSLLQREAAARAAADSALDTRVTAVESAVSSLQTAISPTVQTLTSGTITIGNLTDSYHTILIDNTSGNVTCNMPSASANTGKVIHIVIKGFNVLNTITVAASDLICGTGSVTLTVLRTFRSYVSTGTTWERIA